MRSQLGQRDQKGTSEFSGKIVREAVLLNLTSIIGAFVRHNRYIFGAVQHSIVGRFSSIIRLPLLATSKLNQSVTICTTRLSLEMNMG